MIIRKVKLAPFGAVSNREYNFNNGLNVLFGPNEAGKSTLVDAIFAVLFIPADVKRNSDDWRGFISNCFPYPGGDTARVEIVVDTPGGQGQLYRCAWGANRQQQLILDDGSEINDQKTVRKHLDQALRFGRGTYEEILFARQEEMNRTLVRLKGNPEAVSTVSGLLRAALFEVGGVSLEDLEAKINTEYEQLLSNWDLHSDQPRGGRGINNPHKIKRGKVLETYYQSEELYKKLREVHADEENIGRLNCLLDENDKKQLLIVEKLDQWEKLEDDARKRSALEPQLEAISAREVNVRKVITEWPKTEERVASLQKYISVEESSCVELEKELIQASAVLKERTKRELLKRLQPLHDSAVKLEAELAELPALFRKDLEYIEKQVRIQAKTEAVLDAMKLKAVFYTKKPFNLKVTSGLENTRSLTIDSEETLEGAGRLVLESVEWKIDIQSGQENVEELIGQLTRARESLAARLAVFKLSDFKEAQSIVSRREELEGNLKSARVRLKDQLGELTFKELETAVAALGDDRQVRDPDKIKAEIDKARIGIVSSKAGLEQEKEKLNSWEKELENLDQVLDMMAELRQQRNKKLQELEQLSPLPEEYKSSERFITALKTLREKRNTLRERKTGLKQELFEVQNKMPDQSTEDLEAEIKLADEKLKTLKRSGRALNLVKNQFEALKKESDADTFDPLINKFAHYLSLATNSRYTAAELDGALPGEIISVEGKILPVHLLSAGTAGGAALALRLAMASYLLQEADGFLIMDDPMVHLDPNRRKSAAVMIREFARDKQIIVTTCDPVTAELLGGGEAGVLCDIG